MQVVAAVSGGTVVCGCSGRTTGRNPGRRARLLLLRRLFLCDYSDTAMCDTTLWKSHNLRIRSEGAATRKMLWPLVQGLSRLGDSI